MYGKICAATAMATIIVATMVRILYLPAYFKILFIIQPPVILFVRISELYDESIAASACGKFYRSKPSILSQSNSPHIKSDMRTAYSFVIPWISGSQIAVQKGESMKRNSFSELSVF